MVKPAPWRNRKIDETIANSGLPLYGFLITPWWHLPKHTIDGMAATEVGYICGTEEIKVNREFRAWDRPYGALRDGFHVSALDPYPEGA